MAKVENPYYRESELPLEESEIKQLKKGGKYIPIFAIFFAVFLTFFYLIIDNQGFEYFLLAFAAITIGIFAYITYALVTDIKRGTKQVIQGLVTHKEVHYSNSNNNNTRNRTTYYLHFGPKRLNVGVQLYSKFKKGDLVEIHQAKRTYNTVFKTVLVKSDVQMDQIEAMDMERKSKAKKGWWLPFAIFIGIIPLFLLGSFYLVADCFDCDDIPAASIAEWKNVAETDLKSRVASYNDIVLMLNDTLTNEEEKLVATELFYSARNGDLSQLLQYLDSLKFEDKTAIHWIRYKFDEQEKFKSQVTVVELWQGTLRAFFGIKFEVKKSRLLSADNYALDDVDSRILEIDEVSAQDLKLWLNHSDGEDRQLFAEKFLQKDTASLTPALNAYLKSAWAEEMSLPLRKKPNYNAGREKYGLPVSE